MEEKYMVNDALKSTQLEIILLTDTFLNSENMELKQTLNSLRSEFEAFHSELFTLAISKGYLTPCFPAKPEEIAQIKNLFI